MCLFSELCINIEVLVSFEPCFYSLSQPFLTHNFVTLISCYNFFVLDLCDLWFFFLYLHIYVSLGCEKYLDLWFCAFVTEWSKKNEKTDWEGEKDDICKFCYLSKETRARLSFWIPRFLQKHGGSGACCPLRIFCVGW